MLSQFPDLCIWKKDINLRFVELNDTAVYVFGFENLNSALGKNDYDIPTGLSNFAEIFRQNDLKVIKNRKTLKFLEIQPCVNNEWKILHVVKCPYYEQGKLVGVIGYSVDITKSYIKLEQLFIPGDIELIDMNVPMNPIHIKKPKLNSRESECLFFLLRKCTAKNIAIILKISHRTVEDYIETLKFKFFCNTKIDLINCAKKLGYMNIIPSSILQKQLSIIIE